MPADEHQSRSCVLSWHSFLARLVRRFAHRSPSMDSMGALGPVFCALLATCVLLGLACGDSVEADGAIPYFSLSNGTLSADRAEPELPPPLQTGGQTPAQRRRALVLAAAGDAAQWPRRAMLHMVWVRSQGEEDAMLVILAPTSASPSHCLRLCRWLANATCGQPAFDLALIYFGASPFFGCSVCVRVWHARGAKWNLVYQAVQAEESWRLVSGHAGVLVGGSQAWRCWEPWLPMCRRLTR